MTVEHLKIPAVEPRARYVASGNISDFSFGFPTFGPENISVYLDGAPLTDGYIVEQSAGDRGGTVAFAVAPRAGALVTICRRLKIERLTDYQESGMFRANTLNNELDYLTAALQDIATEVDRCVRLSPGDTDDDVGLHLPPSPERADKLIGFDTKGDVIAVARTGLNNYVSWGGISGNLADQLDLRAVLDRKREVGDQINAAEIITDAASRWFTDAEATKLAGIEPSATADLTAPEIEALPDARYGGNSWRTPGSGSGSALGGSDGSVQVKSGGNLVGDADFFYDTGNKWLQARNVALRVHSVGTVSGTWQPPIGAGAGQTLLAAATENVTLGLPTGAAPPTAHEFFVHVRLTNAGTNIVKVTYSAYAIRGYSGPPRKVAPGTSQDYWLVTVDGGVTWEIVGGAPIPSPITFWDPGTPAANSTIWSQYIFSPTRVPFDPFDIGTVTCVAAPSAATEFVVRRRPQGNSTLHNVARVSFGANNTWSVWSLWNGSAWVAPTASNVIEFSHGDILSIESPANLNGLAGLRWILLCAEREDQS
jgi:hypothetical protein